MSKNIYLHPCYNHKPENKFYSDVCFVLSSRCNPHLGPMTARALPITLPVDIAEPGHSRRVPYDPPGFSANSVDTDSTWLVYAGAIKPLILYTPDWERDLKVAHLAIMAYIRALPDDWLVIVRWY